MKRYVEGWNRRQSFLLPECVDDYVDENNPVRAIEAFVDELDLVTLGFERHTRRDGPPGLSPVGAAETVSLRLS